MLPQHHQHTHNKWHQWWQQWTPLVLCKLFNIAWTIHSLVVWQHLQMGAAGEVVELLLFVLLCPVPSLLLIVLLVGSSARQRARQQAALIAFRSRCPSCSFLLSHYSSAREVLLRIGTPLIGSDWVVWAKPILHRDFPFVSFLPHYNGIWDLLFSHWNLVDSKDCKNWGITLNNISHFVSVGHHCGRLTKCSNALWLDTCNG